MADPDAGRGGYGGFSLEPNWPGLDSAKDEMYVAKDKIKGIVEALEENLARLEGTGMGSAKDLMKRANLTGGQLGMWDTAQALNEPVNRAYEKSSVVYLEIIEKYKGVIALIRSAANIHDETETKNIENLQG
jgi:hypothetical protein